MKLGRVFETLALKDFQDRFPESRVLGRNVRFKVSEIDLVFLHQQTLHFVEVRGTSCPYERGAQSGNFIWIR